MYCISQLPTQYIFSSKMGLFLSSGIWVSFLSPFAKGDARREEGFVLKYTRIYV